MKRIFHRIFAWILLFTICFTTLVFRPSETTRAAGGVTVDLSFQEPSATAGEIVTLKVVFSSFPSITRFGPIEIGYDNKYLEFVSAAIGEKLDDFEIETEIPEDSSMVKISAINSKAEEKILQEATESSSDAETVSRNSNNAFVLTSEDPVVAATLRFRINQEAGGEVKAWLGSLSGFRDSVLETVVAGAGTSASLLVQAVVSSDATLSTLSLGSVTLTPEFDPGIFSYQAVVSKNTTDVAVNATAYNVKSTVDVQGQSNLKMGDNLVKVTVTAEDGESIKQYLIKVFRSDALSVEGISLKDKEGKVFQFQTLPETVVIPADFYQSTFLVEGNEVPCFQKDGVKSVLIYVRPEEGKTGLYAYDQDTETLRLYEPGKMMLRPSRLLTVETVPTSILVPEGFTPTKISYGSVEMDGYISKDKKTCIAYMRSEDGNAQFYVVDTQNGDFYPYKTITATSNTFLYLFIVCASIAFVEAIIITIMFYRKRHHFRHQAKPRRV